MATPNAERASTVAALRGAASTLKAHAEADIAQAASLLALAELIESSAQAEALLTIREATAKYRVSESSLRDAVKCGQLSAVVGSRRKVLLRADDVLRWSSARVVTPRRKASNDDDDPLSSMLARGEVVSRGLQ